MKQIVVYSLLSCFFISCASNNTSTNTSNTKSKHHLNIPEQGIESRMEQNSKKIIEGTDESIVISVGNVTRQEADISVMQQDKILQEKLVHEKETIPFVYEGTSYTITIGEIKKPLLGAGKVSITLK